MRLELSPHDTGSASKLTPKGNRNKPHWSFMDNNRF